MIDVITSVNEVREKLSSLNRNNNLLGFVPTMGYLHKGHLNLVEQAKKQCDIVIVSIFVNPTQFGENEDFDVYPRDIDRDSNLLAPFAPLIVFAPLQQEMYEKSHCTGINVAELENKLCGSRRPGHFRGVATVIAKFLNIIAPDLMFMGEKDFQQVVVLERMLSDLNYQTKIVRCPTVREDNGLAMSSRNKYLTPAAREDAGSIYKALRNANKMFADGITDSGIIRSQIKTTIEDAGGKIDYIEIVDSFSLASIDSMVCGSRILVAAFFGETRLIDNIGVGERV